MKVIDLLNKIANNEDIPKKIIFNSRIYELKERDTDLYNYKNNFSNNYFEDDWFLTNILNDEVEIIEDTPKEDKKIEKIEERIDTGLVGTEILDEFKVASAINKQASYTFDIAKKINEIIDKINGDTNE